MEPKRKRTIRPSIPVYITAAEKKKLKKLAKAQNQSMSGYVLTLVQRKIAEAEKA